MREEHERLGIPLATVTQLNRGQAQTAEEARSCDALLAPSRFVADSYIARGISPEKVHVLPWGTDTARFHPAPRNQDGTFRVMCVAQISPRKGHIDLLDAWKLLNLPNSELVFLGEATPEMQGVFKRRQDRVVLRGHVSHERLSAEFQQADVVVLPSIEDGFSYVPLEAMACGVPVVVSCNAGASEMIEQGVTGFVIPIRSPQRIAEAIETLYRSAELRAEMGRAARREIVERHSWADYAERLVDRYRKANRARVEPVTR
jgi:glycosyltransferase involved in cell wall biosynthesis